MCREMRGRGQKSLYDDACGRVQRGDYDVDVVDDDEDFCDAVDDDNDNDDDEDEDKRVFMTMRSVRR